MSEKKPVLVEVYGHKMYVPASEAHKYKVVEEKKPTKTPIKKRSQSVQQKGE